jgi:hypothetical protein
MCIKVCVLLFQDHKMDIPLKFGGYTKLFCDEPHFLKQKSMSAFLRRALMAFNEVTHYKRTDKNGCRKLVVGNKLHGKYYTYVDKEVWGICNVDILLKELLPKLSPQPGS